MTLARRSPLHVFSSVVIALMFRELKTRFGGYRLGYVWALFDPVVQVIVYTIAFGARGRQIMFGIDFTIFLLIGLIAYDFFAACLTSCAHAIEANEGLFVYKQVKPFDVVVTRVALEFIIHLSSFTVLLSLAMWLGSSVAPADPFGLLLLVALLILFSGACGLLVAITTRLVPETRKAITFVVRPLYLLSCVFLPLAAVPEEYRGWLLWNPFLHFLELMRQAYFASYVNVGASWWVVLGVTFTLLTMSLLMYRRYRIALVTT